jgi:DinB superfamily
MFNITQYCTQLLDNTKQVIEIAKSLPQETLLKKEDTKWSMLECLEHIAIVDKQVLLSMLKMPDATHDVDYYYGQNKLQKIIVDFRNRKKITAPISVQPKGIYTNIADWQQAFTITRNKWLDYIGNQKIIVDNRYQEHPFLGNLTMSDWCYFIISHADRHCLQLQEMR